MELDQWLAQEHNVPLPGPQALQAREVDAQAFAMERAGGDARGAQRCLDFEVMHMAWSRNLASPLLLAADGA